MSTLNVVSAGAMKPALATLGPSFGQANSAEVALVFGPAPEVRRRVMEEGGFDVVIGPVRLMDALAEEGQVDEASRVALGGVKAAVAVHRDAEDPDISTPDAVRGAIRAASAVVYNTASSGQFIDEMIKRLGIAEEVEPRVKRFENGEEAMKFLGSNAGRTAIGFGQSSAIRGYESTLGVRQVGPLPAVIGNVTEYEGAVATASVNTDLARAFLGYLVEADSRRTLVASGIE